AIGEGTNLYFTNTRVDDRINASSTIASVGGTTYGDILSWDGTRWETRATSTLSVDLSNTTGDTDDITEGSSNLYWTNNRFDIRLTATTTLPSITTLANLSITESQISDLQSYFTLATWFATTSAPQLTTLANLSITESQISDLTHTVDTNLTQEEVEDFAGALVASSTGTHTDITITYQDATSDFDFIIDTLPNLTGTLDVDSGGTGATTFTTGEVLVGNGTGAVTSTSTANLKASLALNLVENTALSTWAGTSNITTLGTITSGTWQGTTIAVNQGGTGLTSYTQGDVLYASGTGTLAGTSTTNLKASLALNLVENTALSTWAGSSNLITLGTITTGVWNGTSITNANVDDDLTISASGSVNKGALQNSGTLSFDWIDSEVANDLTIDSATVVTAPNFVGDTDTASTFVGNVGIGTTSPYAKLSVVGEIVSAYITATTSATSTLPQLDITDVQIANGLEINSDFITDFSGIGLQISGTSLALNATGDWTGTFDGQEGSYYLDATNLTNFGNQFYTFFNATNTTALSEGTNLYFTNTRVDDRINASTTIARTSDLHDSLTLAGTPNYLTLSGQEITLTKLDITDDTNLTAGTGITLTTNDLSIDASQTQITALGTITTGTWEGTTVAANQGGTGQSSYTIGDLLYANTASTLARLGPGANGQVLKLAGGVPTWGADITTGGGGGAGAWSTTTDSLGIYPTDTSDVIIIGSSATSSTGYIFEVAGSSYFDGGTLLVDALNDRVGIGTSTPGSVLSIQGVANFAPTLSTLYSALDISYITATSTTASSTFPLLDVTSAFALGSDYITDLTGTGLTITGGALTVDDTSFFTLATWFATTSAPQLTTLANLSITESQISNLTHTTDTNLTREEVEDFAGALVASSTGTHTDITITYQDATSDFDFIIDTLPNLTGTLDVDSGGTGATTFTSGEILVGNGTGALTSTSTANLKASLALNLVENTALSTWAGSSNLITLGTITTGVWNGTSITNANVDDDLTISSSGSVNKGALQNSGTLSFDWVDSEVANDLTIDSATVVTAPYFVSDTTATSTFAGAIDITEANATSTFAHGIDIGTGCLAINGTCLSTAGFFDTAGTGLTSSGSTVNVIGGVGITANADDIALDGTEIDAITWSDGVNASNIWTFDVSGTDTTATWGSALLTLSGALTINGTLSGVSAIDATTETTIESAIDTLGNLTSASALATVGTITSGVWNGTSITNANVDDDLTISSSGSVDKGALQNSGTLSFDWVDSEVADDLTIDSSTVVTSPNFIADSGSATSTFAGGLAIETTGFVYDFSSGNVGIGTANPDGLLTVGTGAPHDETAYKGLQISTVDTATGDEVYGAIIKHQHTGANSSTVHAAYLRLQTDNSSGTMVDSRVLTIAGDIAGNGAKTDVAGTRYDLSSRDAATITNLYDIYIEDATTGGSSSIANQYGLYIENLTTGGTLNYPIYVTGGTSYFGGNVGIGTTSPYAKLSVAGEVVAGLFTATTTGFRANSGSVGALPFSFSSDTDTGMYNQSANNLSFATNGSNRLELSTTYATFSVRAEVILGSASAPSFAENSTRTTGIFFPTSSMFAISTGGIERLRIDASGNVGIGTTTPYRKLEVYGVTNPQLRLANHASTTYYTYTDIGVTNLGEFSISNQTRSNILSINKRGQVGIGATSLTPSYTLDVSGTFRAGDIRSTTGGTFADKVDKTTGSNPQGASIGDVNNDGYADLAVANDGSASVSVFINNGDGTFADKVDYTAGTSPVSVSMGDVNNDGYADLAVANQGSNLVSVFINNGDGTFADKVDYGTQSSPIFVEIGDLNNDGYADLAVANNGSDSVSIFINDGDGTFATKVDYTTGTLPYAVSIGDLNNDGYADLAVANFTSNSVSVLINDGDGTFATKVDYNTETAAISVSIGDLNNDGYADLAVANFSSVSVSIFMNNGDGTFADKVDYTTGTNPHAVSIGDLNNDGYADLAVANQGSASVSLFMNNGDGTFAGKIDYTTGTTPRATPIGDVNNDGYNDFVVANYGSASVSVFLNSPSTFLYAQSSTSRVGIATTTPWALLAVNPNGITGPSFAIGSSTKTDFIVTNGGNVGIGTTTPGSLLSVEGDAYITGSVIFADGSTQSSAGLSGIVQTSAGDGNTAVGNTALDSLTGGSGLRNTAFGTNAGTALTTGDDNVLLGYRAGDAFDTEARNIAIGPYALGGATYQADDNIAIGYQAGDAMTTATRNVGIGTSALGAVITGDNNVAVGYNALILSTAGNSVAIGARALDANTSGANNIAIGVDSLGANQTGDNNVAVGTNALILNIAADNVAVGNFSLDANTSGTRNTAVGKSALSAIQTTNDSTAIGFNALLLDVGGANTAVGSYAADAITSGVWNVAIGTNSLSAADTSSANTAIGFDALALNTSGDNNVAVGADALNSNLSGGSNIAVGREALTLNTASSNTAIGHKVLAANTSGTRNTGLGFQSLNAIQTTNDSTAVGYDALLLDVGGSNTAVGSYAGDAITSGTGNIGIGLNAVGAVSTASRNIGIGNSAIGGAAGNGNVAIGDGSMAVTTGGLNVAVGDAALDIVSSGSQNTALGRDALGAVTGSSNNVGIGAASLILTTGANNIALGWQSGDNLTSGSNNLIIGYDIDAPSATASNQLNIGNLIYSAGIDGTGTTLSSGNLGIGTTTPGYKLSVEGTAYFADTIVASALTSTSTVTGASFVASSASATSTFAGGFAVETSGLVYDFSTNNVGIGTASPDNTLDVSGTFQVAGTVWESVGAWSQIGSDTVIASTERPSLTSLSATRIAFVDHNNNDLRTYDFNGTTWSQVGNELNVSAFEPKVTALSSTRVAYIEATSNDLRTYDFDGTDWTLVGNLLDVAGMGTPSFVALSSNRIAFIDGGNDDLRTYDFDGTDWAQVGNDLNITGTDQPTLTKLSSTRVAFIDSFNDDLRTYSFDGTDWTQVGNDLNISSLNSRPDLAALSTTHVAYIDQTNADLRVYEFDGTNWSEVGTELNIATVGTPALTGLSATRVAFIDETNKDLRVYDIAVTYFAITTDAAANLGLGTTTPNNKLDIYSTTAAAIGFSGASGSTYKWTIGMDVTNAGRFAISSSTALGTTDRLVIDGAGNVGIGSTTPWALLAVNPNGITGPSFAIGSSTKTDFIVTNSGNVGIGTTSPPYKLSVAGFINTDQYSGFKQAGVTILHASSTNLSVFVGANAGAGNLASSFRNAGLGYNAGTVSTGNDNVYLGYNAGLTLTNVGANVIIGSGAMSGGGSISGTDGNVAIGEGAMSNVQSNADDNIAIGQDALTNVDANSIVAIGVESLDANTTGPRNTGVGHQSLSAIITAGDSTAVGYNALLLDTGGSNTAIGSGAGDAIGSGSENVAIGFQALTTLTTGVGNVAIGNRALDASTGDSNFNVAVGIDALGGLNNATGDNNIALGYSAGINITSGASNLIIGNNVEAPSATASNQLNIGNLIFSAGIDGTGSTLSSGNLGIATTTPWALLAVNPNGITGPSFAIGSSTKTDF
ncbi:hypothetical protein COB55_03755, partial [Candidatus Wolfebacteria bacterium]